MSTIAATSQGTHSYTYIAIILLLCRYFFAITIACCRFLNNARVCPAEPIESGGNIPHSECPLMICYPEKQAQEAMDIFMARYRMHHIVYTHKTVKKIEYMVTLRLYNYQIFFHLMYV